MPRSVFARRLNEVLHWTNLARMPRPASSRSQYVRVNRPRSSSAGSGSISQAPARPVSRNRMPSDHADFGHRDDEAPSAPAILGLLRRDLVEEVPRQQQQVVGPVLAQPLGRQDRQGRAPRGAPPPL